MEGGVRAVILWPWRQTIRRRLAIDFVIALHLGLQTFINVGVFSIVMIAYTPFLLTAADWRALAALSLPAAVARGWAARAAGGGLRAAGGRAPPPPRPPPPPAGASRGGPRS